MSEKETEKPDFVEMLTDGEVYEPESDNTGAPKNFMIRCPKCRWARPSSGLKADLTDLYEIKPGCRTCGKWRKFRCKKCGAPSPMVRTKSNT